MRAIQNKLTLEDSTLKCPPDFLLDKAIFTSPIGLVLCRFTKEGRLISCSPLEDMKAHNHEEWIILSEKRHPSLAKAMWECAPPPIEYNPLMTIPKWAPHFWDILTEVPYGTTLSYSALATYNGLSKNMCRAVARLLGTNPIFILYPCHRIIRANGELAGYRWGVERKKALLEYEASSLQHTR